MTAPSPPHPVRVATLDVSDLVRHGLTGMLAPYADRVVLVDETEEADVVLADAIDRGRAHRGQRRPTTPLVVYSWDVDPLRVADATARGAAGYLSQRLAADDLVDALERVCAGETVISSETGDQTDDRPDTPAETPAEGWPGQDAGLTARESTIIALITEGLSNQEIAERSFLSINSVKSYIRSSYRKMGVSSRSQAVLWGIREGFR